MTHTPRTELVYRLSREVGRMGEPISSTELGRDILVNRSANLITTLNRSTGEVRVRDRWNGTLLFDGTHDDCATCAPTTLHENPENEHADVDLNDIPRAWVVELQDELKEVAA